MGFLPFLACSVALADITAAAADYVTSLIFVLQNFKDSFGNLRSNLVDLGNLTVNEVDLGGYFANSGHF